MVVVRGWGERLRSVDRVGAVYDLGCGAGYWGSTTPTVVKVYRCGGVP